MHCLSKEKAPQAGGAASEALSNEHRPDSIGLPQQLKDLREFFAAIGLARVRCLVQNAQQVLNTPNQRSNRHVSAVLSCPEFHGFGQDGATRKDARTSDYVCSTSCPPDALEQANGGFLLNQESETMTTSTVARTATSTPTTGTTSPRTPEQALIGAYNAAGLAQSYLEKGSYHAAKRKIIAALRDIEVLTRAESEVSA